MMKAVKFEGEEAFVAEAIGLAEERFDFVVDAYHASVADPVWSVRTVGSDGRVPIGTQRLRVEKPPQTKVIFCLHPCGHHSVLVAAPDPQQKPALPFTNRPK
jgi:hypothetical protein